MSSYYLGKKNYAMGQWFGFEDVVSQTAAQAAAEAAAYQDAVSMGPGMDEYAYQQAVETGPEAPPPLVPVQASAESSNQLILLALGGLAVWFMLTR